jgi:uncharacterized protein
MSSAGWADRPIVLSTFDLPDADALMVRSCEDCACPVGEAGGVRARTLMADAAMAAESTWMRGQEVTEMRLDSRHWQLFNPVGHGGVVVLNEPALAIFAVFEHPVTIRVARAAAGQDGVAFDDVCRRLAALGMIHPAGEVQRPQFASATVLTAWLHVTNACNLRCPYCYISKSNDGMTESVWRSSIAAVMRSAQSNGFEAVKLKYAGGEASLHSRHLLTMHEYAKGLAGERGLSLQATLLSNGVSLPPALVQMLKAEQIRVMISLDGVGDQHDVQRPFVNGKPSFRFVDATIRDLLERGHPPHLSITITSRNARGVPEVVRYALDRQLSFSLNFFRDNDCAATFADLQYEERDMISALLETFEVIRQDMPSWSVLGSILDRGQLLEPRQHSCGVGHDYVVIDQNGKVAKCHMEIERTLGDVFRDDPLDLVRRDTTTTLNLLVDEKEGCRDCKWRYWCSGGCSVATFRATGRYDVKSPNCNIYEAIYPQALRLEGLRILKYGLAPAG